MTILSIATSTPGTTREEIENRRVADCVFSDALEGESSFIFLGRLLLLAAGCNVRLTKDTKVLLVFDDKIDELLGD